MYDHSTDSENVLMYIDSAQREVDHYRFVGWIAHKNEIIKGIKVRDAEIPCIFTARPDVLKVYPTLPTQYVGVDFVLKKSQLDVPIFIRTENCNEYRIGKMIKRAVMSSGFKGVKRSITVVDDFYHDPDFIRDFAIKNLEFKPSGYHKGCRSERFLMEGTKEKLEEIMGRKILNWNHPQYANGVFQFCTSDDPIVYHSDTQTYAAAVYLTPSAPLRSGTSTYRSKLTGAMRFDPEEMNSERFKTTFSHGGSELNFYDNSSLEIVDSIANVYNRLVVWDGRAIHAGNGYFGTDINDSRFFQLFFFDLK
jgi:hypothetical protein